MIDKLKARPGYVDQQNHRITAVDLATANRLADGSARDFEDWRPIQPNNASRN